VLFLRSFFICLQYQLHRENIIIMSCRYHFSTCYDNRCVVHYHEKTIVGWFPREPVIPECHDVVEPAMQLPRTVRGIGWKETFVWDDEEEDVCWAVFWVRFCRGGEYFWEEKSAEKMRWGPWRSEPASEEQVVEAGKGWDVGDEKRFDSCIGW
jgi:hypothetical protein